MGGGFPPQGAPPYQAYQPPLAIGAPFGPPQAGVQGQPGQPGPGFSPSRSDFNPYQGGPARLFNQDTGKWGWRPHAAAFLGGGGNPLQIGGMG